MGANKAILIVGDLDYASGDIPLREITLQIDSFKRLLQGAIKEAESLLPGTPSPPPPEVRTFGLGAVFPVAISLAPLALGVVGLFKRDYVIKEVEFDLKQEALVASVARWLREWEFSVYLPNLFRVRKDSPLLGSLQEAGELALRLMTAKGRLKAEIAQSPRRNGCMAAGKSRTWAA